MPRHWSTDDVGSPADVTPTLQRTPHTGNSVGSGGSDTRDGGPVYLSTPSSKQVNSSTKAREANVTPDAIRLGIACMKKKMNSPTMQAFINKFEGFGCFTIVRFSEDLLLQSPVEDWPNVDCAIMFFSSGFPLDKACEYFKLHRRDTYFLTEPESQKVLLDRRDFYRALERNNIPLPPNHAFCNRDGYRGEPDSVLEEHADYVVIDGKRLDKPFVEKPVDAEDHRVRIYYPSHSGGGCRMMFRKVADKSSEFDPDVNEVRRDGSYLYESFVEAVDRADIKCYTVGPEFVHAESRKAPVVDGRVDRDHNGKEKRASVALSPKELMVARKIIKVFRQMVCGFDLLRVSDQEFYICDVNGWSFVKNNDEYIERAATIMRDIFLAEVGRRGLHRLFKRTATARELMGVVGVYRHGDRTPKQKLKLAINSRRILDVAFAGSDSKTEEVVVKGDNARIDVLADAIRAELDASAQDDLSEPGSPKSPTRATPPTAAKRVEVLKRMLEVTTRRHEGLKLQVKPKRFDAEGNPTEAQLVCKWGGWLTAAGESQAQAVGQHFVERVFGNECGPNYLRDVTASSNNERRVMRTARLFLDRVTQPGARPVTVDERLLGDNSHAKQHLDDIRDRVDAMMHVDAPEHVEELRAVPGMDSVLHNFVLEEDERTPLGALKALHRLLAELVDHVNNRWRDEAAPLYRDEPLGLLRERWTRLMASYVITPGDEAAGRPPRYDVTKLTDVFDYVSYDVCYNQPAFHPADLYPLFSLAQCLSALVSEAESGLEPAEKLLTGSLIGLPLLHRIYDDLVQMATGGCPRTRLYFTSSSHVNALRHILYNTRATEFHNVGTPLELHFLSHFVFKVYRYPSATPSPIAAVMRGEEATTGASLASEADALGGTSAPAGPHSFATSSIAHSSIIGGHADAAQFQIEVHFSTGVDKNMFGIVQDHHASYGAVTPMIRIHNNLTFVQFLHIVQQCQRMFSLKTGHVVQAATIPRGLRTPSFRSSSTSPTRRAVDVGHSGNGMGHSQQEQVSPTSLLGGFPISPSRGAEGGASAEDAETTSLLR